MAYYGDYQKRKNDNKTINTLPKKNNMLYYNVFNE